jgi:hypothetical protein
VARRTQYVWKQMRAGIDCVPPEARCHSIGPMRLKKQMKIDAICVQYRLDYWPSGDSYMTVRHSIFPGDFLELQHAILLKSQLLYT